MVPFPIQYCYMISIYCWPRRIRCYCIRSLVIGQWSCAGRTKQDTTNKKTKEIFIRGVRVFSIKIPGVTFNSDLSMPNLKHKGAAVDIIEAARFNRDIYTSLSYRQQQLMWLARWLLSLMFRRWTL